MRQEENTIDRCIHRERNTQISSSLSIFVNDKSMNVSYQEAGVHTCGCMQMFIARAHDQK